MSCTPRFWNSSCSSVFAGGSEQRRAGRGGRLQAVGQSRAGRGSRLQAVGNALATIDSLPTSQLTGGRAQLAGADGREVGGVAAGEMGEASSVGRRGMLAAAADVAALIAGGGRHRAPPQPLLHPAPAQQRLS